MFSFSRTEYYWSFLKIFSWLESIVLSPNMVVFPNFVVSTSACFRDPFIVYRGRRHVPPMNIPVPPRGNSSVPFWEQNDWQYRDALYLCQYQLWAFMVDVTELGLQIHKMLKYQRGGRTSKTAKIAPWRSVERSPKPWKYPFRTRGKCESRSKGVRTAKHKIRTLVKRKGRKVKLIFLKKELFLHGRIFETQPRMNYTDNINIYIHDNRIIYLPLPCFYCLTKSQPLYTHGNYHLMHIPKASESVNKYKVILSSMLYWLWFTLSEIIT